MRVIGVASFLDDIAERNNRSRWEWDLAFAEAESYFGSEPERAAAERPTVDIGVFANISLWT